MIVYPNVTEQDLINLRKSSELQKNQHAIKNKNRIFKQTLEKNSAENLSPITEKLDTYNGSTKK